MERKRDISTLMSIFDLKIHKALCLPHSVSTRVMFFYDKNENKKAFTLLNKDLNRDTSRRITAWLMENTSDHNLISNLKTNEMDADRIKK